MRIFLIAPVRGITDEYREAIASQVEGLERQGNTVHWPERDTLQKTLEKFICEDNREAMRAADAVYVIWDGKSEGCLFDLGMAFAMEKRIVAVTGYTPRTTIGKSFANLIHELSE